MKSHPNFTPIDHSVIKAKILNACIKQHQKNVDSFRLRVNELIASETPAMNEYDSHQQPFKSETIAEVSLLADQLQLSDHELDLLMKIPPYGEDHHLAEYGSVVRTDKETFFVSAGTHRFYADDYSVLGLPVHSPIYKAMKGKRMGECFTFEGVEYHIEEIF